MVEWCEWGEREGLTATTSEHGDCSQGLAHGTLMAFQTERDGIAMERRECYGAPESLLWIVLGPPSTISRVGRGYSMASNKTEGLAEESIRILLRTEPRWEHRARPYQVW